MAKVSQQLFEPDKQPGAIQAGMEAFKAILSPVQEIGGAIWDGGKGLFDHGRTEMAAALFSGQAHVMYMRGQEGIEQGQDQVQPIEPSQEKEMGGMEL